MFTVYRGFNTAVSRPKAVMLIQVTGLALKVPLSVALVWGVPALGIPPLGVLGCAIATGLAMWTQALIAWLVLRRDPFYAPFELHGRGLDAPERKSLGAHLRLGLPMGAAILIEVSGFSFMAIFIARLGTTPVAGHQIAMNLVTLMFMVPLAIASAALYALVFWQGRLYGQAALQLLFIGVSAWGWRQWLRGTDATGGALAVGWLRPPQRLAAGAATFAACPVLAGLLAIWLARGSLAQLDGQRALPGLSAPVTVERDALGRVDALGNRLEQVASSADELRNEVRGQSSALKRMDSTLWNVEQERLRQALATPSKGA
jgi:hypothetical protein